MQQISNDATGTMKRGGAISGRFRLRSLTCAKPRVRDGSVVTSLTLLLESTQLHPANFAAHGLW
jgi:hypothetical protein